MQEELLDPVGLDDLEVFAEEEQVLAAGGGGAEVVGAPAPEGVRIACEPGDPVRKAGGRRRRPGR